MKSWNAKWKLRTPEKEILKKIHSYSIEGLLAYVSIPESPDDVCDQAIVGSLGGDYGERQR